MLIVTNAQVDRIFAGFDRLTVRLDGLEIVSRDVDCLLGKEMHTYADAELEAIIEVLRATCSMLAVPLESIPPPILLDGVAEARALMLACKEAARSLALLTMDADTDTVH